MNRSRWRIALLYRGPQGEGRDEFSSFVPIGLFYILHSLLAAGYRARLYNLSEVSRRRLADRLRTIPADAVLVSAFFGCHREAFRLAELAKRFRPKAPVVLGGPLAVLAEAILRREGAVDFVVRGEGEETVVRLLDAVLLGRGSLNDIAGLYRRQGGGMVGRSPVPLADLDRYFFLPSEILPHCRQVRPENLAILIASRGCPFRCTFCSSSVLWQNRLRRHSPELLVRYLRDLQRSTGALYCSIRDENFLADRRHVLEFCRRLREAKLHFLWNCQGSVRFLDAELAGALAAAGCDQVQMGIETVSPRLQRLLGKRIEAERVHKAASLLRRQGVRPFGYFIYGMEETPAEAEENLAFVRTAGLLDAVAGPLVYYPGTALAAGVPADRFLCAGEILLYDPKTARRYRRSWEAALAELARTADFSKDELFGRRDPTLVRRLARSFHHLRHGRRRRAEAELEACRRQWPDNPWPVRLLGQLYEEEGDTAQARRMAQLARRLVGR